MDDIFDFTQLDDSIQELESSIRRSSRAILIVDDEPENVSSLSRTLHDYYKVHSTTSPLEALEIIKRENIDLILTDQRMPVLLGTEMLQKVREISEDNISIILTAYTDSADLITCINQGLIYRFLVKPWERGELLTVVRQAMDKLSRDRIIRRMIPNQVVDRLFEGALEDAEPGQGKELECTVLFLDIRGFTALVETMEPREAFAFLTSFVTTLAPLIKFHHGFVDKYLGDGLMAIFDRQDHFKEDSLKCAIALHKETVEYNRIHRSGNVPSFRDGEEPRKPISIGISINVGTVILGAIGSRSRVEFTVLGDTVNVASRIEELTKALGTSIICHEEIAAAIPEIASRRIGEIALRGKEKTVRVCDVFDTDHEELRESKLSYRPSFEAAMKDLWDSDSTIRNRGITNLEHLSQNFQDDQLLQHLKEFLCLTPIG